MGTGSAVFILYAFTSDEANKALCAGRGSLPDREMHHSMLTFYLLLHELIPQHLI
jgi:hypothetical protein